ncbi:MAG: putative F0F1-ATPase subunit Ca2+/Mg2+ transporter [Acidobacteriota bacterium]|jgi:ATP synthase protein I|nr:putative F0F1-ATPase subunit Ca2+/Mg2+ transporter [Acidobacteriota bacterium]
MSKVQSPKSNVAEDQQAVTRKSGMVYAAVLSFVLSTVAMLGLGWLLDRWLGTAPWLVVTGIVVGAGVGFYQFVRLLSRIS